MSVAATLSAQNRAAVVVGAGFPVRVMALVGANHLRGVPEQIEKVEALQALTSPPTIVADLSLHGGFEILEEIVRRGFFASTLPIYGLSRERRRIDRNALLERALAQISRGASMLTIHPTPTRELIQRARSRLVPWTSRGGGLVIEDLLQGDSDSNAYLDILPDLAMHARAKGVTLSIGAAFRSANIFDTLDEAQTEEISLQIELARQLASLGVSVILESPGHARPRDIRRVAARLASAGFPVMPLGPIPTDTAIAQDHVAAAIGATLMGLSGAAHLLAAVTREEHTGGIPSLRSTIEAVECATVAAHVIDLDLLSDTGMDAEVAEARAKGATCVVGKSTEGCSRCAHACPLKSAHDLQRAQGFATSR